MEGVKVETPSFFCATGRGEPMNTTVQEQPFKHYRDMLFPQCAPIYKSMSNRTIPQDAWEYLQTEAQRLIDEDGQYHPKVKAHWHTIVAGKVPFGYKVKEDDR